MTVFIYSTKPDVLSVKECKNPTMILPAEIKIPLTPSPGWEPGGGNSVNLQITFSFSAGFSQPGRAREIRLGRFLDRLTRFEHGINGGFHGNKGDSRGDSSMSERVRKCVPRPCSLGPGTEVNSLSTTCY
ncbi:hypothetical protein J6590_039179 [Homalodisca vitripennis]|nr:hypothetical protein J6590_039179 [Homalodisca vitripennis]